MRARLSALKGRVRAFPARAWDALRSSYRRSCAYLGDFYVGRHSHPPEVVCPGCAEIAALGAQIDRAFFFGEPDLRPHGMTAPKYIYGETRGVIGVGLVGMEE